MKLNLPVPRPHNVERFRELMKELHGVELSDAEALDQCIRLVQYLFLTEYALPALRKARDERASKNPSNEGSGQTQLDFVN